MLLHGVLGVQEGNSVLDASISLLREYLPPLSIASSPVPASLGLHLERKFYQRAVVDVTQVADIRISTIGNFTVLELISFCFAMSLRSRDIASTKKRPNQNKSPEIEGQMSRSNAFGASCNGDRLVQRCSCGSWFPLAQSTRHLWFLELPFLLNRESSVLSSQPAQCHASSATAGKCSVIFHVARKPDHRSQRPNGLRGKARESIRDDYRVRCPSSSPPRR